MAIKVMIPTPLRPYTDKQESVSIEAGTVGELLEHLTERYQPLRKHLVNDEGRWVGTGWGTGSPCIGVTTLTGEEEYEGLTARLVADYENYDDHLGSFIIRAVIVEGELPPYPDPIE